MPSNEDSKASKPPEKVLVLRTVCADMHSRGKADDAEWDFVWPESGEVTCPDWEPTKACGHGLHGWLWGHGHYGLKQKGESIWWLILEVDAGDIIDLDEKVKFPRATVLSRHKSWWEAMAIIRQKMPPEKKVNFTSDHRGHAAATGYSGHAAATGDSGHAAATGNSGHAAATGYSGHAAATGNSGHAAATGNSGHAAATGDSGWAAAGRNGDAVAGENGVVSILWWDEKVKRPRLCVGYVGEDGIKPNVKYRVQGGKLVEVASA